MSLMRGSRDFEGDGGDVIDLCGGELSAFCKGAEPAEHLVCGQVLNRHEVFAEVEACNFVEGADERLCTIGIDEELIAGLELNGLFGIFGVVEDTEQRSGDFQLGRILAWPDEDRIRMACACESHLEGLYVKQAIATGGELVAGELLLGESCVEALHDVFGRENAVVIADCFPHDEGLL